MQIPLRHLISKVNYRAEYGERAARALHTHKCVEQCEIGVSEGSANIVNIVRVAAHIVERVEWVLYGQQLWPIWVEPASLSFVEEAVTRNVNAQLGMCSQGKVTRPGRRQRSGAMEGRDGFGSFLCKAMPYTMAATFAWFPQVKTYRPFATHKTPSTNPPMGPSTPSPLRPTRGKSCKRAFRHWRL